MPENPPRRRRDRAVIAAPPELDEQIRALRPGEVVTTYAVVLSTRYVDEDTHEEGIARVRYVPAGTDPHLTLGYLRGAVVAIERDIA